MWAANPINLVSKKRMLDSGHYCVQALQIRPAIDPEFPGRLEWLFFSVTQFFSGPGIDTFKSPVVVPLYDLEEVDKYVASLGEGSGLEVVEGLVAEMVSKVLVVDILKDVDARR